MKLHGAFLVCLVCGALGASVPSGDQSKPSAYLEKLVDYRRSLLEFNWRIDESKYNLNKNLRSILNSCNEGNVDIPAIEEKIHNLRSAYANQIAEYRDTLNSLYNTDLGPQLKFGEDHKQDIEVNLKKAEANFDKGVKELSLTLEKLKLDAVKVKADGDSSTDTGSSWFPSWTTIYNTILSYFPDIGSSEYVQNVQNTVSSLANNVTALFNQNQGIQVVNNNAGSNDKPDTSDYSGTSGNSGSDNSGSVNSGSVNSGSDNSGSVNSGSVNSGSDSSSYSDNSDRVDPNRLVTKLPTPEAPSLESLHPQQEQ